MKYTSYFKNVYDLYSLMEQKDIILVCKGEFTQQTTKSVLSMTEQNMEVMGELNKVKRKVFNIMMECLQNVCKHSEKIPGEGENKILALFVVGKNKDNYFIITGNPMLKENKEQLENNLIYINSLDKVGLRQYYKDKIQITKLSDKGGAGLGFIDIARRTNKKLDFNFEPIDENLVFFSLKIVVSKDTNND